MMIHPHSFRCKTLSPYLIFHNRLRKMWGMTHLLRTFLLYDRTFWSAWSLIDGIYIFQDAPNGPSTGLPPLDFRPESQCDSNTFSPSFQSNYCARLENHSDPRHSETVDFHHPVSRYMRFLLPSQRNLILRVLPNHFHSAMDLRNRFLQDKHFLRRFLSLLTFQMTL